MQLNMMAFLMLENYWKNLFRELYRINNYWNSLYPGEYCKQCGSNNCHCGVIVFLKRLE